MQFSIEAYSVWCTDDSHPKPDVSFVPPMERRRLTGVERAALAVAWPVRAAGETPVVFASRWGEIGVTLKLMRQFQADGEMSPAGFSASVHNAAPGAFSLLTKNRAPYTAVAARARSLEAGLLEALVTGGEVVYVYAEEETPDFYRSAFGPPQTACSVAVRLRPVAADVAERGEAKTVKVDFRSTALSPATFADWVAFLEERTSVFATADLTLTWQR